MKSLERPYFMRNPEWFYFDEKEGRYKLTDKAPRKAKMSYDKFYEPDFIHFGAESQILEEKHRKNK